jgi:hypothetical protein
VSWETTALATVEAYHNDNEQVAEDSDTRTPRKLLAVEAVDS